jgi:hypothetical protein
MLLTTFFQFFGITNYPGKGRCTVLLTHAQLGSRKNEEHFAENHFPIERNTGFLAGAIILKYETANGCLRFRH